MTALRSIEYKGYTVRKRKTTVKGHEYTRYVVDFGKDAHDNRVRRTFATEAKARAGIRLHLDKSKANAEAQTILQKQIGEKAQKLSTDDLLDAVKAMGVLMRSTSLTEAAAFYMQHNNPTGGKRTVTVLVAAISLPAVARGGGGPPAHPTARLPSADTSW
jgi:hypothetical protein